MSRSGWGKGARRSAALWRYALTALLGYPGRRVPASAADRARRSVSPSSYETGVDAANALQFGRAYWLPPFGHGNGLDALFWTASATLPADRIEPVLRALADRGIPAWSAAARARAGGSGPVEGRPHDLWVASAQLDEAQDVVMRVLAD